MEFFCGLKVKKLKKRKLKEWISSKANIEKKSLFQNPKNNNFQNQQNRNAWSNDLRTNVMLHDSIITYHSQWSWKGNKQEIFTKKVDLWAYNLQINGKLDCNNP